MEALLRPQPVERQAYIDFNVITMQADSAENLISG
jgi:hypothetical protein